MAGRADKIEFARSSRSKDKSTLNYLDKYITDLIQVCMQLEDVRHSLATITGQKSSRVGKATHSSSCVLSTSAALSLSLRIKT